MNKIKLFKQAPIIVILILSLLTALVANFILTQNFDFRSRASEDSSKIYEYIKVTRSTEE